VLLEPDYQYFEAKKMDQYQVAVFMEERKWHYRGMKYITCLIILIIFVAFGFVAALLEGLPIIGLVFSISNPVGAAMWAHGQSSPSYVALDFDVILVSRLGKASTSLRDY
jgi:hypothetical protein